MDERGLRRARMNARIETIAGSRGARIGRCPEAADLHPARGIMAAVGLSLLLWGSGFALLLVAWF